MNRPSGVLYICTGPYQDMLKNSLNSLERTNPNLDFHVLSDRPLSVPYTWVPSFTGKSSRRIKTGLFEVTPFELTLFVDTDTVFGEAIDIADLLGDADLAMGLDADPLLGKGARTFLNYQGFTSPEEAEETLNLCGESFPFYNSGVMIWRQTERVRAFFERWHSEWLKYQRADQLALARALALSQPELNVRKLPQRYNFPVLSPKLTRDKAIYHLIFKERIAKETGLWEPEFDLVDPELTKIARHGARSENQYLHIGQMIYNDPGASSLIICPNKEEYFWRYCADQNCKFVVQADSSRGEIADDTCVYKFESKVGEWTEHVAIPEQIDQAFDYVIINGPEGFNANCPGREIPVSWASRLARKAVFVFDYNRNWERQICDRHLGDPHHVIAPEGKANAELAVFAVT
jgi:hypothetical protein